MAEPTAALTYNSLILFVAETLGVAYYGADGTEVAQVPVDAYLLAQCKKYVLGGIRMFIADGPPEGWRWQRPVATINIWQDLGISMPSNSIGSNLATGVHAGGVTTVTATADWFSAASVDQVIAIRGHGVFTIDAYVSPTQITLTSGTDYSWSGSKAFAIQDPTDAATVTGAYSSVTTVTAAAGSFFPSTVGKTLYVTDVAAGVVLDTYVSDTVMTATGDVSWAGSKTFSLPSDGIYRLPSDFGGEITGDITYAAGSNLGVPIDWVSELEIRRLRANWNGVSGNPYYAATRVDSSDTRRWNLLVYPNPGGTYQVLFPYLIYFDSMVNTTDLHPAGFAHDETVKAAALWQAELDGQDAAAGWTQYYEGKALPNSRKINDRAAPKRLGYNGNPRSEILPLRDFRQSFRRPTVIPRG